MKKKRRGFRRCLYKRGNAAAVKGRLLHYGYGTALQQGCGFQGLEQGLSLILGIAQKKTDEYGFPAFDCLHGKV